MIEQAAGGTLFLLVAIVLAILVAFALLEAWMLYSGRRPITQYVRQGVDEHAKVAARSRSLSDFSPATFGGNA